MNILFLCTGNSCRSIIAEALLKSMAPSGVTSQSAGSKPARYVHPRALIALQKVGIATEGFCSGNRPLGGSAGAYCAGKCSIVAKKTLVTRACIMHSGFA